MPPKRKGLGRGLDALIPNKLNAAASTSDDKIKTEGKKQKNEHVNSEKSSDVAENGTLKEKNVPITSEKNDFSSNIPDKSQNMIQITAEPEAEAAPQEKISSEDTPAVSNTKNAVVVTNESESEKVLSVKISLVEPNREQPRKKFNEEGIEELAASISQYGVIQPLLVQWKDNYYEIIAGERRWRAAMKAGLKEIPVIVKEYSNKEAVEISLIENIQREDLNPIEEALAYERLVMEFEMTQEQVAERVSKSRSAVTNSMRLLKLEGDVREMIISGDISEGHARTLLSLPTAEAQKLIADRIIKEKLSVRDTEKLVKKLVSDVKRPVKKRDYEKEAILGNLSEQLKNILGTKVSISENSRHRGKIEIEYYSDDELNRIFEMLQSIR